MPSILQRGSTSELPGQSCRAPRAGGYGQKLPTSELMRGNGFLIRAPRREVDRGQTALSAFADISIVQRTPSGSKTRLTPPPTS